MYIPHLHTPIYVDNELFDLSHLNKFVAAIPNKGRVAKTGLNVDVVFSCHVYTERSKYGDPRHVYDHRNNPRKFCRDRYDISLELPLIISDAIISDDLTFIGKDYNQASNLLLLKMASGMECVIVFVFEPMPLGVRMEIISAYAKQVPNRNVYKKRLSYYARQCMFGGKRIP